jgi:hypothetical protein
MTKGCYCIRDAATPSERVPKPKTKSYNMQEAKKRPRYRPGVAQKVGKGIALLFQDLGTRRR